MMLTKLFITIKSIGSINRSDESNWLTIDWRLIEIIEWINWIQYENQPDGSERSDEYDQIIYIHKINHMDRKVKSMNFMKTNQIDKSNHIDKINQINWIHIDPDAIRAS